MPAGQNQTNLKGTLPSRLKHPPVGLGALVGRVHSWEFSLAVHHDHVASIKRHVAKDLQSQSRLLASLQIN